MEYGPQRKKIEDLHPVLKKTIDQRIFWERVIVILASPVVVAAMIYICGHLQ